jgi:hypothetical protein
LARKSVHAVNRSQLDARGAKERASTQWKRI